MRPKRRLTPEIRSVRKGFAFVSWPPSSRQSPSRTPGPGRPRRLSWGDGLKTDIAARARHALAKSRRAFYVISTHHASGRRGGNRYELIWAAKATAALYITNAFINPNSHSDSVTRNLPASEELWGSGMASA